VLSLGCDVLVDLCGPRGQSSLRGVHRLRRVVVGPNLKSKEVS
jgi:hypothetical protein